MRLALSALALLASTAAAAQTAPDLSLETLKTITQTLSSDQYEGRAPATAAEVKTLAYLVDPNWNWDGALEDLTIFYRPGRQLADGAAWPNWYPTAEFRAVRDKSRAGQ